jgi:hypothetical protein
MVTPSDPGQRLGQQLRVLGVPGGAGNVDLQPLVPGCRDVERRHDPARLLDRVGQLG